MKEYSNILISLLKGIVHSHNKYWNDLLDKEQDVKDYFADINLDVIIDKPEGYAYLRQKENKYDEDEESLKLIERRQLSFHVSLLCLLLRKHLIESDHDGKPAILSKDNIIYLMKPFYKETTNEANSIKKIEAAIKKVKDEGFLRQMESEEEQYEVSRMIKAFIEGDVVKDELKKLENYVIDLGKND